MIRCEVWGALRVAERVLYARGAWAEAEGAAVALVVVWKPRGGWSGGGASHRAGGWLVAPSGP